MRGARARDTGTESGTLIMSDRGTLEKLLIKAYEIEYDAAQGSGTTGSRMNFKKMKPGDMSLTFFIDGTGANGKPSDVQKKVEEFQTVTLYNGKQHRTNYLKVVWGTLTVKRCV